MAEAFEKGDLIRFSEFLADDVTYHMPGKNLISGDYHGVEAVPGLWKRQGQFLVSIYGVKTYDIVEAWPFIYDLYAFNASTRDCEVEPALSAEGEYP